MLDCLALFFAGSMAGVAATLVVQRRARRTPRLPDAQRRVSAPKDPEPQARAWAPCMDEVDRILSDLRASGRTTVRVRTVHHGRGCAAPGRQVRGIPATAEARATAPAARDLR